MSFILDALKKSESERQRQHGPALFEVKVAPPRQRFPTWAAVVAALLVVNLGAVAWLMMRDGEPAESRTEAADAGSAQPPAPSAVPAQPPGQAPLAAASSGMPGGYVQPPQYAVPPGYAPVPGQPVYVPGTVVGAPPPQGPMPPAGNAGWNPTPPAGMPATGYPYAGTTGQTPSPALDPTAPQAAQPRGSDPQLAGGVTPDANVNPDDFLPAQPAPSAPARSQQVNSAPPSYEEVAARPGMGLPELRLDLHVYSPQPSGRFVYINSQQLREGDSLPQGVRVERITEDGATLSYRGTQFTLTRN